MKTTQSRTATLACAALLLSGLSVRGADEPPRFSRINEIETEFVTRVGTAIVKAARLSPSKITLSDYQYEAVKDKKGRKDLKITMKWVGLTKKTYTATIVVKIDVSDEKKWEVLNVEYKDNAAGSPSEKKIQELIEKFNKE